MTDLGASRTNNYPLVNLADKLRLAASNGQLDHVQELLEIGAGYQRDKVTIFEQQIF